MAYAKRGRETLHQLAAQELVIQQLRDALDYIDSENASEEVLRRALQALATPTSTVHLEAIESLEHQLATVIAQRDLLGKILSCQVKLNESEACLVYQDCYEALASLKGE